MASALSPNIGAQITFRFLAGFFVYTPLTNFGGSVTDMWCPLQCTYVFPVCACLSFWGPFLTPMVGAFIGQSDTISWRWTEWVTLIMIGLMLSAIVLFVPKTDAQTTLKWNARHLREIKGEERHKTQQELDDESFATRMKNNIYRAFKILTMNIMVVLFSLYMSTMYIVLFTFLTGYDYIFGDIHGFKQGNKGLTRIVIHVGFMIALAIVSLIYCQYKRRHDEAQQNGKSVQPEQRM